jgi:hypothetical protein
MALEDEFDPDKRQRKYNIKNPEQVLVRLKVEHSGFTTLNNQRFGSRFVGEVVSSQLQCSCQYRVIATFCID